MQARQQTSSRAQRKRPMALAARRPALQTELAGGSTTLSGEAPTDGRVVLVSGLHFRCLKAEALPSATQPVAVCCSLDCAVRHCNIDISLKQQKC